MKGSEKHIKATKEGRLYIRTSDFFKQEKIKRTIEKLMDSDLIKGIDKSKKIKSS